MNDMNSRQEIREAIRQKRKQIDGLNNEIAELKKQDMLLCDEQQWFKEEIETFTYRENRKKKTAQQLVGRVYWMEEFKDEDSGDKIMIERNCVVRIDGEWQF